MEGASLLINYFLNLEHRYRSKARESIAIVYIDLCGYYIQNNNNKKGIFVMVELFLFPACFFAAINDFLFYKIPNWLVGLIVVTFLLKSFVLIIDGASLVILQTPLITFCIVLTIGFILYVLRIFGAGDAKLLAACSLWLSDKNTFEFIFLVIISGGLLAFAYILFKKPIAFIRHLLLAKIVDNLGVNSPTIKNQNVVPYAVAIFAGVIWVVLKNG